MVRTLDQQQIEADLELLLVESLWINMLFPHLVNSKNKQKECNRFLMWVRNYEMDRSK
jgi:hypothetical protein